jgi:peptidyl-prolyl cis-trans isomerase A (cyclophilin A)
MRTPRRAFLYVLFGLLAMVLAQPNAEARRKKKKKEKPAAAEQAKPDEQPPAPTGDLTATFQTSMGDIVIKLYEDAAPKTVANFVALATGQKEWTHPSTGKKEKRPLYDGTFFHRVLPKFMIQGGDPLSAPGGDAAMAGTGGPGFTFEDEVNNGRTFDKGGYLAMANRGPNTNGSQFFITEVPTPHLDNKHTIFGEVVTGADLIPKIARAGNMKVELRKVLIKRGDKLLP